MIVGKKSYLVFIIIIIFSFIYNKAYSDVLYSQTPSYDQSNLDYDYDGVDEDPPGMCSIFSIAMALGYYDTTGWKRFVPYGSNSAIDNPGGVYALSQALVASLSPAGTGMSLAEWYGVNSKFTNLVKSLDNSSNFSANYDDIGGIITWSDITNGLNIGPGVFVTWSNIEYRYDYNSTLRTVSNHAMTSIGYKENYSKWSIITDWLLVKSTWEDGTTGYDPLWINWDDIGIFDDVAYLYITPGGSPSSSLDTTDDSNEDNDFLNAGKSLSSPYTQSNLNCNDPDWYKIYLTSGTQLGVTISFTHSNGDLDLRLYNSSSSLIASSTGSSNSETVNYSVTTSGYYYINVYGFNGAKNTYSLNITAKTFTGLAINGPTSVNESSSATYTATASWSDGSTSTVTPTWSEDSAYATISTSGVLTTSAVTSNQNVTITASYTTGGVTKTDTHALTIVNSTNVLTGLTINGPTSVNESSSATYTATAAFDNGSTSTVTPTWSEDSAYATISTSGVLTTSAVTANQNVTITASYTAGGVPKTATKTVTIVNSTNLLTGLTISGPGSVNESSTATYTATALWEDGSSSPVTPNWNVSPTTYASINSSGLLTTTAVTANQIVTITASYTAVGVQKTATKTITITMNPNVLTGITIAGPDSVNENSTAPYTATATWDDGSSTPVTPAWSASPTTYASINSSGLLTTTAVTSNQTVTITANYTAGGVLKTATKSVTIVNSTNLLTGLTISGPDSINESSSATYTATASWDNDSTSAVTPTWSVTPTTYASINSGGLLTATAVTSDQTVTITANYTAGGVPKTASKTVTIINSGNALTGLTISGPDSVNESSTATYTATASWEDGSSSTVTPTWSVSPSSYSSINSSGLLTATAVTSNQTITLTASYTAGGVPKTATKTVAIVNVIDTLTVNSVGADSVTIAGSPIIYGGVTNYTISSIPTGTPISLTAPPTLESSFFTSWSGCTSAVGATCNITLSGDKTVTANYTTPSYIVSPLAGQNGSISPATDRTVLHGNTTSFTLTPNTGYHIDTVSGCGGSLAGNTYTTGPITGNCTVSASFAINEYTVTPEAGPNGSISPATDQTVAHGSTTSFTIIPNTGYRIDSVTGCGGFLAGSTYTTGPITANCTVSAVFTIKTYNVKPYAGSNGSISPATDQTVAHGSTTSFTLTPNTGYHIDTVSGCGGTLAGNTYTTGAITSNCTVIATFAQNIYSVIPAAGDHGSIAPATTQQVLHGGSTSFTIIPDTGYHIDTVSGGGGTLTGNTYSISNVTGDCTVSATFLINEYTVIPSAGDHGSISPATAQTVPHGDSLSFTVTPDANYHILSVTGCGGTLSGNTYTIGSVTGNCTVTAAFAIDTHTVTSSAGAHGSISPSGQQEVNHGDTTSFTVTPDTGYHINTVTGCGGTLNGTTYTTGAITAACTVSATFSQSDYTVTPLAGPNGSISPATAQTVLHGDSATFTITPNTGYHIDTVTGCGGSLNGTTYTTGPITASCTVTASFAQTFYTITATSGPNGSITPSGTLSLAHGASQTFTITPDNGYHADKLFLDGIPVSGVNSVSLNNITSGHTIHATFAVNRYTVSTSSGANGSISPASDQTVDHGAVLSYTVTPDAHYHIASVTGCDGTLAGDTYTTGPISSNCTVTANFVIDKHAVTPAAGPHGSITPNEIQLVEYGSSVTFIITPDTGYHIESATGCGGTLNGETYTTDAITSDCTVSIGFSPNYYTVVPSTTGNGSISPETAQLILHGATTSFTLSPDTGYHLDTVTGCGGTLSGNLFTTAPVVADCIIDANFATDKLILAINVTGKGSGKVILDLAGIDCASDCEKELDYGSIITLSALPAADGSRFVRWSGDCTGADLTCEITMDRAKHVEAFFTKFPWPLFMPAIQSSTKQQH